MNKFLSIITLVFLSTSLFAQFELIEKVEPKEGSVIIPYEKYKLTSNGLTLIIHQDKSTPISHVEVAYHVGSARESVRNSGFAHFFEHMMFQGSKNVEDEEHFKIISEAGGTNNAYTSFDKTVYHQTAPSNLTETMLWLEADRMGTHLDGFTQEKFENQRDAVKNEKLQRYDNQPYGMVNEILFKTLFANHPYEWTPIGFVDDLDDADFDDLRNFFLRWYGPNNATVIVTGDVDPEQVKSWVAKYFGGINQCPPVRKMPPKKPILAMDLYVNTVDNVFLPSTLMAIPTVPEYHPDEAALDILAEIIGGGSNSIIYQKLVKTKDALQAGSFHQTLELAGMFAVQLLTKPEMAGGFSVAKAEQAIREAIADFEKREVTEEDILVVKNSIIKGSYGILNSIASKASVLGAYSMEKGNGYNLQDDIDRYASVTIDDIKRVYRKYIKGQKAVFIRVDPDKSQKKPGEEQQPKSINPHAGKEKVVDAQYKGLTYTPPVDDFDRSVRPTIPPAKNIIVPDLYKYDLNNGLKVIGSESNKSPIVYLYFDMDGGHLTSAEKKINAGTAMLTAALMNEGTKNLTSEQFERELEKLGSTISFSSGTSGNTIYVSTLKDNLDQTLNLLKDALFNPRFDSEDFDRIKEQTIESLSSQRSNPSIMAQKALNQLMYNGALKDYYTGDYKSLKKIKLSHVVSFYETYYSPHLTRLMVTGDIDEKTAREKLAFLNDWKKTNATIPAIPALNSISKTTVYLVDKAYAPQTSIIAAHPAMPYDYNGDFFKSTVMNFPLGGAFNSRINLNLREEKGYTYGSRTGFSANKDYGYYIFSAEVKKSASDSAIMELMKEINNFQKDGMTEEELQFTKSSLIASEARQYETPLQRIGYLNNILKFNLPEDFKKQQNDMIKGMTLKQLNQHAKNVLKPNNTFIIVVGHAYKIRPGLKKLGYDFKELKL
jgi:zinc protease